MPSNNIGGRKLLLGIKEHTTKFVDYGESAYAEALFSNHALGLTKSHVFTSLFALECSMHHDVQ